jgi:3-hydroxybutyryl-CoA dehydrogenase
VAAGRLGRKSGHGFYRWVDGVKVDPAAAPAPGEQAVTGTATTRAATDDAATVGEGAR